MFIYPSKTITGGCGADDDDDDDDDNVRKRQWSIQLLSRPEDVATKGEGIGHFDTELYPSPSLFPRLPCPTLHPPPPHQTAKNNNNKTHTPNNQTKKVD